MYRINNLMIFELKETYFKNELEMQSVNIRKLSHQLYLSYLKYNNTLYLGN